MFSVNTYLILKNAGMPPAPCNTGPLRLIHLLLVMQGNTGTKHPMENLLESALLNPVKGTDAQSLGKTTCCACQAYRKSPTNLIRTRVSAYLETTCGLES